MVSDPEGLTPPDTPSAREPTPAAAIERLGKRGAERRRAIGDGDAGRLHGLDLVLRRALAAGDDGAGVSHATPGRRGHAGDEARHRLLAAFLGLGLDELGSVLLGRTADL